ncbi:MAG: hypothetical protein ABIN01_16045 [Ferruginibacter sp.]
MYTFIIKDNGPDVDILVTRSMLALSAIAALVYRSDDYYYLNVLSAVVLLLAAIFINVLVVKFRIKKFVLLSAAAVVLFIATHSIAFAVILLLYGYLVKFLYKKPLLEVADEGITIRKLFSAPAYQWNDFSNVVLKDNLLTLDFKNNKLIQVNIDEGRTAIDEEEFNYYCKTFM